MPEEESNVFTLRPEQDMEDEDRMLKVRPVDRFKEPQTCYGFHKRVELDGEAERVYCRDCGAEVPPFKALQMLAADGERYIRERQEASRRTKVAEESMADLEKRERNAKSRVRNWTKKAPKCECAERSRYSHGPWCCMCGGVR